MGTDKRERQKAGRQARIEAAEAARKKAEGRRRLLFIVGTAAFVVVVAMVFTLVNKKSSSSTDSAATSTTLASNASTTVAQLASAAGQPCVALADPLPAGAPDVPVPVGPPPTELVKQDLVTGTGDPVPAGGTVTVNYIGVSCSTGKIFDSSYSRGQTATFPLTQVIKGWTDGIPGMQNGGRRLLVIPAEQAYGSSPPAGGTIAPDETLIFVVDLVSQTPAGASSTTAVK